MSVPMLKIAIKSWMIYCILPLVFISSAKRIRYITTEQPGIVFYDRNYFKYFNLTSQRYGRSNPFYFVGLHMETLFTLDNNLVIDFYFFEYLSNVYKRGFIEMHFGFCDLVHKNNFFGAPMRQGKLLEPCPHPPGKYNLYNMSIDIQAIPPGFPFKKGRIYCNASIASTKHQVLSGFINMEVKEMTI